MRVRNSIKFGELKTGLTVTAWWRVSMTVCVYSLTRPSHWAKCSRSQRLLTSQGEEIHTQQKLQSPVSLVRKEKQKQTKKKVKDLLRNSEFPKLCKLLDRKHFQELYTTNLTHFKALNCHICLVIPQINQMYIEHPIMTHKRIYSEYH